MLNETARIERAVNTGATRGHEAVGRACGQLSAAITRVGGASMKAAFRAALICLPGAGRAAYSPGNVETVENPNSLSGCFCSGHGKPRGKRRAFTTGLPTPLHRHPLNSLWFTTVPTAPTTIKIGRRKILIC